MWWSKKTRPDMKLAADWKAMNRQRAFSANIPIYEERQVIDRDSGDPRTAWVQTGTKPGVNRIPAIPRRDLHRLAMGIPR
jgi:hypothetical protein